MKDGVYLIKDYVNLAFWNGALKEDNHLLLSGDCYLMGY